MDHSGLVNIRNGAGHSALHLAVMMGHDDVFRNLIAAGANTEIEDVYGLTPLRMAIMFGQRRIIELVAQLRLPGSGLFVYAWYFHQMWALQTLVKSAESLDDSENKHAWSAYDGPLTEKSVTGCRLPTRPSISNIRANGNF
jgi:ankyrin repeat protein